MNAVPRLLLPLLALVLGLIGRPPCTGAAEVSPQAAQLLRRLAAPSAAERLQAVREAAALPHPPPALVAAVVERARWDPDRKVRLTALDFLTGCPPAFGSPPHLEEALAGLLRDPDRWVRCAAAQGLFSNCVSPPRRRTLRALARLLADPDPVTRDFAAGALARAPATDDAVLHEALERALAGPDSNVPTGAVRAYVRHLLAAPGGAARIAARMAAAPEAVRGDWIHALSDAFKAEIRAP